MLCLFVAMTQSTVEVCILMPWLTKSCMIHPHRNNNERAGDVVCDIERVTLVTGPGFIYIRIKAEARGGHRLFTHHSSGILQPRRLNIYTEILGSFFQSFRSLWDVIFSYLFQDLIWKLSNNLSRVIWEIARQRPGINPHWPKLVGVQVQDLRRQHPVWSKPWEMMVNQMYISSNILIINKVCKQCIPGTAAHCHLQHSWLTQNAHTWQTAFVYIGHCHHHRWFLKLLHCPLLCRKTFLYTLH